MLSRGRSFVRLMILLMMVGAVSTNCTACKRMRQTPRQHWWEFWKPKRPAADLYYPQGMEATPTLPPPATAGPGAPGTEMLPIETAPKAPADIAGGIPETKPLRTPPRGMVEKLQTIYFDYDRFDIKPDARGILDGNAEFLAANPDIRILVEGHCDERGTTEYNLHLGQRRADGVREYLVSKGIAADRIETISYGEERPIDPGHDEPAYVKNRRVQFQVK